MDDSEIWEDRVEQVRMSSCTGWKSPREKECNRMRFPEEGDEGGISGLARHCDYDITDAVFI